MQNPKVSVVIPAYNHERYVGEAIQSVLNQTFQDFELIIINDGSTDHTEEEILKFHDPRIRYYSQENRGLSATLNRGIELTRGEFFTFLPSDDVMLPEKLQIQTQEFQKRDHDLGILFSKQVIIDANGLEVLEDPIIDWFNVPYQDKEEIFPALFEKNFLAAPTMMCKKECFEKVGGFDESIYYCQDYDMWLRIIKFYEISILQQPLIKYRWHGKNLTYVKSERADFERAVILLKAIKNLEISDIFPRLKGLNKKDHRDLYARAYVELANRLIRSGLIEVIPVAYSFLEEAKTLIPNIEIEKEMENLINQRPHFIDLRDQRLNLLSREISELKSQLECFQKIREFLGEESQSIYKKLDEFEKQKENLQKEIKEFKEEREKQEREFSERLQKIDEKEHYLSHWESELIAAQKKWDDFVRKPWIKILRFSYKILKIVWKNIPEPAKGLLRTTLKNRIIPLISQKEEHLIKPSDLLKAKFGVSEELPRRYETIISDTYPEILHQIKSPKVSVVLPIYNQSDLAEEAIKSVLNQTYTNIELIIVNDGSTDRLPQLLSRYGFNDKILILNQEHQGLPRALTNGFKFAKGSFFTWTSADNIMLPEQIETHVNFLLKHPDVDMVYSNVEIIDESGNPALNSNYRKHNQYPPGSNKIYLPHEVETLGTIEDNFINASFLYRSSVGKVIGEYDPCLLGTEDYDYWLRINTLFTLRHLDSDKILYQYRIHENSLSERYGKSDIFENAKKLIRYHKERIKYYNEKFDIIFLNEQNFNDHRIERLALEFRDQGHNVIIGNLNPENPGQYKRKNGVVEICVDVKEGVPQIKESISSHRQYSKALFILTFPFKKEFIEPLKEEDVFFCLDLKAKDNLDINSLNYFDAITLKSQVFYERLNKDYHENLYLIEDGINIHELEILKKARDNFYRPLGHLLNSRKALLYYGPLIKDFFDFELLNETLKMKKEWDFLIISPPGKADKELADQISGHERIRYLGERDCGEKGDLYQILSEISLLWAPIPSNFLTEESHEESIQKMIQISAFSGRPILIPEGLNFSEIPFVFQFKDAKKCADLLDQLIHLNLDFKIFDRWISRNTWNEKSKWFIRIANNKLFYRNTREPIKEAKKLYSVSPSVYNPLNGKINVLIQVRSLDKGGLEEVILNLISYFDYSKINVLLVCEEKGGAIAEQCKGKGIMVKILSDKKEEEYREILKKYSIDIVNPHYANFGLNIAHEMGIPIVSVLHNTYVWFDSNDIACFKKDDPYITKYIAVSENVALYSIKRLDIPREKIQVIPNGLDILKHKKIEKRKQTMNRTMFGIKEEDFLFLNIASYDGRKGHHTLLSALKRIKEEYPNIKVLCVGNIADPHYYKRLNQRISAEGLEKNIILHDFVENTSSLYPIADAFILPSIIEGCSISVMEAMFYGLPLILSDVGNNREIIEKVENGILIPTNYGDILRLNRENFGKYCYDEDPINSGPLAKAMVDFYNRKEFWKEQGQKGREAVCKLYRIEDTTKAYENLFSQIIKERKNYKG